MNLDFAKVCGKHNAIYEAYYKQIDPKGSGAIEAMVAAKFLKKSGLSDVVLSRVWDLSDPNGKGFLDKPGFFVALKLVSLAQAGQVVNMSNIYMETANPPKVGDLPKIMPPRIQTVPVSSGGVANGDWSIGVIDRLKYEQLFESQKPVAGKLPGNKVKGLLMESKLPMDTLGKIWDLADQDKDGNLDKHEFIVAMHLVYQTLEKRTVPDVLPPELRKPGMAGPPPKPVPPVIPGAPMPRAPSGDGFGEGGGFVANFPKDIAPPPIVPVLPPAPLTRVPPVGASVAQPLISTDPLIPIGAPITGNVEWVVTPQDLIRYEVMFRDSDRDKDGLVSGLEVKNVFLQSGVAQQCLAHIWALCDTNQSGKLTLEQFALAMWMVERKQKGIEPPQVLTANMVPPSMRAVIGGVDLQSQEPKPSYSNPELEMISKEIEELAKERRTLETEIAQKEADIRIKSGEVRSLQNELDTLSATLKQLENQRGEAQKRLDDLKSQVNKIREQCQKQEDTINEQEGELNTKRSELQKLKDEETALQKEYDDNNRELTNLTQHLQNTQLQISSIRSMVTQLLETQRQMTDALLLCRAAIENQDGELVSEYQLKIEPDFDDARKTLERKFEETKSDPFEDTNNRQQTTAAISNGFGTDPFTATANKPGFDDSFSNTFSSGGFDSFASGFGQSEKQDPFASNAFANKPNAVTPDPAKDDFGSDPFAALHAPTGQGQVLSPNTQKSGPPPRPESPSPALPPKKSKVPPPRPAPPRPVQGPSRTTPQSTTDAFGSSSGSGGFADFADFDNKLVHIPPPLPPPLSLSASSNTSSGSTTPSNKMLANLPLPPLPPPTVTTATTSNLLAGYSLFSDFTPPKSITTSGSSNNNSSSSVENKPITLNTQSHLTTTTKTMQSLLMSSSLNPTYDANATSTTTTNALDVDLPTTTTTTTQAIITGNKTPQLSGPTDFKDDPFKDYRYEDPFSLKDPFADDDDDDINVFADPNKVFKDELSSDDDEKKNKTKSTTPSTLDVRQTPIGSDFLNKFDAFTLSASPVPITVTKSKSNTPVSDFDNFADFDAFSTTVAPNASALNNNTQNSEINNKSDNFFDVFNDNFELNDKNNGNLSKNNNNNNNFNNNLFEAFGKTTTPTSTLDINQSNKNNKNNNSKQAFDAFDAFSTTTTTTTKSEKLFEDDFNDNSFGDNFFNLSSNKTNNNFDLKINTNEKFDEFDNGGSNNFVADFNTALNNSKNFNGSNTSTSTNSMPSSTTTLTKVQNKTTLTKLDNSNAGKLPDKFVNDFSQPDTFDADLEEALRRSMIDQ